MSIIYKATNQSNNKFYIGKTNSKLNYRINQHTFMARKGSNTYFHNALRKYGITSFSFEILEECDQSIVDERECYFIKCLSPHYNLTKGGDGGNTWVKMDPKRKQERLHKLKVRPLAGISKQMKRGQHVRDILSNDSREKWTENFYASMKEVSKRRKSGNLTDKEREGYNNLRKYWRSDEVRAKRSMNAKGERNSNYKGPYYVNGKEYKFLKDIMKEYHVSGNYEQVKYYLARKNITLY